VGLLDKYELGEVLAEGEARTRKAREVASGREVLVHQLSTSPDRGRSMDLLRMIHRFLRGRTPGTHNPILDLGEHDGAMCLVTERIPGFVSVRSWLERQVEPGQPNPDDRPPPRDPPPPAPPSLAATLWAAANAETAVVPQATPAGQDEPLPMNRKALLPEMPPHADPTEATMVAVTPPVPSTATTLGASLAGAPASFDATRIGVPAEPSGLGRQTVLGAPPPAPGAGEGSVPFAETPRPSAVEPPEAPEAMKTTILPAAPRSMRPGEDEVKTSYVPADRTVASIERRRPDPGSLEPPRPEPAPGSVPLSPPSPGEFTRVFQGLAVPRTFQRPSSGSGVSKAWKPATAPGEFTQALQPPSPAAPAAPSRDLPGDAAQRETAGEFSKIFGSPLDGIGSSAGLGLGPDDAAPPFRERPPAGEFTSIFGAATPAGVPVSGPESRPVPDAVESSPGQGAAPLSRPPASAPAPPGAAEKVVKAALPTVAPPSFSLPAKPAVPAAPQMPPAPTPPAFTPPARPAAPPVPAFTPPPAPQVAPPALKLPAPAAPGKLPAKRPSYLPLIIIFGFVVAAAAGLILYFAFHH